MTEMKRMSISFKDEVVIELEKLKETDEFKNKSYSQIINQLIVKGWREKFAPTVPPEITQALEKDPQLLNAVEQIVQEQSGAGLNAPPGMQGTIPTGGIPQDTPEMPAMELPPQILPTTVPAGMTNTTGIGPMM